MKKTRLTLSLVALFSSAAFANKQGAISAVTREEATTDTLAYCTEFGTFYTGMNYKFH